MTLLLTPGCRHRTDPSSSTLSDPVVASTQETACATPYMPVDDALCDDLPADYGLSPTNPAEWGFGAGTRTLWFGRLMCEDGAMPAIERSGNLGEAPAPSSSPESPSDVGALDILDLWTVTCPGKPTIEVYHNMYRCGSPCPPVGTRLIPALAYSDYIQSYKAHDEGNTQEALAFALGAHEQSPGFELISLWLALVSHESGRIDEALLLYDEVLAINPGDVFSMIQKAHLLNMIDRTPESLAITSPLMKALDASHPLHGDMLCAHATALLSTQPDEARALAQRACATGATACC